jgi:hypothetical protein
MVACHCMGRDPPPAAATIAATVGEPASGLLLLDFFFFMFLFLPVLYAATFALGLLAFSAPGAGWECHARPSTGLVHLSARL